MYYNTMTETGKNIPDILKNIPDYTELLEKHAYLFTCHFASKDNILKEVSFVIEESDISKSMWTRKIEDIRQAIYEDFLHEVYSKTEKEEITKHLDSQTFVVYVMSKKGFTSFLI